MRLLPAEIVRRYAGYAARALLGRGFGSLVTGGAAGVIASLLTSSVLIGVGAGVVALFMVLLTGGLRPGSVITGGGGGGGYDDGGSGGDDGYEAPRRAAPPPTRSAPPAARPAPAPAPRPASGFGDMDDDIPF